MTLSGGVTDVVTSLRSTGGILGRIDLVRLLKETCQPSAEKQQKKRKTNNLVIRDVLVIKGNETRVANVLSKNELGRECSSNSQEGRTSDGGHDVQSVSLFNWV